MEDSVYPMPEKIHYEDNIFFMTLMVRTLNNAVKINVDAEYFAEKVLEDTLFLDAAIQKLYGSLKDNQHLIRRNSYLHLLMKLKKAYGRLLEDLLAVQGAFAAHFETQRPKIRRMAAGHLNEARDIQDGLERIQAARIDSDTISFDELQFLMSPMDDSPDS